MNYPRTIKDLIECFKKLPGIGEKTANSILDYFENDKNATLGLLKPRFLYVSTLCEAI